MSVSCPFIIQKAGSITLHEESLWLCSDRSTVRGNAVRGAHDCRNQQNVSKEWRADMGQKCWRTILFLLSPPHTYSRLHSWHSCWDGVTSVCSTPALYSENQTYCCLCNPVSKTCEWMEPPPFIPLLWCFNSFTHWLTSSSVTVQTQSRGSTLLSFTDLTH